MTAELKEFTRDAQAWFKENTPKEQDFMLPLTFMEVGTDQQFDFLREWQNKVYEAGYLGRKNNAPIMLNAIGLNWTGPLLLDMGSETHKKTYIKGILSAEDIWAQGFSEPENGSDLGNAQLKAERDGDSYVLNGSKIWTTQGNFAKYMILLARTNPEAPNKYAGLSFILTPMRVPGIETHKIRKLTGEYGFTQTFFTDARIPADGLMGQEGQGWKIAMQTLEYERGARGGQAGGYVITQTDPLEIIHLARKASRGGAPAMDDPVIRDKLVDFIIEAQAINMNNARAKIAPLNSDKPMGLPLMSKLVWTEYARRVNEFALNLQGTRAGYYVDEPNAVDNGFWHRSYLNAFSATIGGGTSQIQHNIIGEHVLGLPKTR